MVTRPTPGISRNESPGVKFADADLIGIPLRLTVSSRTLKEDSVELKRRDQGEARQIKRTDAAAEVVSAIEELNKEIAKGVEEVPYDA